MATMKKPAAKTSAAPMKKAAPAAAPMSPMMKKGGSMKKCKTGGSVSSKAVGNQLAGYKKTIGKNTGKK